MSKEELLQGIKEQAEKVEEIKYLEYVYSLLKEFNQK